MAVHGVKSELISVQPVTRPDSGLFVCRALNSYGQAELNTQVLVLEPPDPPSGIQAIKHGSRNITLKWELPFSGNSQITKFIIQWKRENG